MMFLRRPSPIRVVAFYAAITSLTWLNATATPEESVKEFTAERGDRTSG